MALLLPQETKFGITADYHKISKIEWSVSDYQIKVLVDTYVSVETRDSGANPLKSEWVWIPPHAVQGDLREWVYPLLANFPGGGYTQATGDVSEETPFNISIQDDGLSI